MNEKFILDACCGGKCFWFDKNHKNTIYIDNRIREKGHDKQRPNHEIKPDIVMDFRDLKFPDKTFKLIVYDPPHLIGKPDNCILTRKYGYLNKETWREDILKGFNECYRVLEDYGILIFKWSEISIKKKEVLNLLPIKPLFGNHILSKTNSVWFCFMKIPKSSVINLPTSN